MLEEPQHGFDIELGLELGQYSAFVKNNTDSFRLYGGGYYFDGDHTENIAGWRGRFTADVTQNVQVGARFQRDDERGSQGFLEATFRFPFSAKKSYREEGLRARLDEAPERDIDIVTGDVVTDTGDRVAVVNKETGAAQEVLNVDNTAAGGGDGSAESPFNSLTAAAAASSAQTVIYVKAGDGTDTNQDQGIALNKEGLQLVGSGSDFVYDGGKFSTANGKSPTSIVIAAASSAPVISNSNVNGDGVTVAADNVVIAGITVDGAGRDGIVVEADGAAASAQNVVIENVTLQNNRHGIYIHGTNSGAVSAKVQSAVTTANSQHGIAVYDDTDGTFEADLGGGSMGSAGNNVLAGNTLEDLAVEYDGRALAAQGNWWGQASGADTDDPSIGIAPQIYYGAPVNDGLVGHWTFDTEWTSNTTAYDRSGQGNDGDFINPDTGPESGVNRQSLNFNDVNQYIEIPETNSLKIPNEITIGAWVKNSTGVDGQWRPIFEGSGNLNNQTGYYFGYDPGSNSFRLKVGDNVSYSAATKTISALNQWFYAVGTFSIPNDSINLYVDNVNVSSGSHGKATISYLNAVPNRIGALSYCCAPASHLFDGNIDDTRIYNRALSASEISELYRMDTSSSVDASGFLTSNP